MSKLGILVIAGGMLLVGNGLFAQEPPPPPTTPVADSQKSQTWSGALVDADCKGGASEDKKCDISPTTKSFGLQTADGKFYKFDDAGNAKVRAALSANNKTSGMVSATLRGSMSGDTIKVDSVELQ